MVAPPTVHALGLDQEMAEHTASPPHLLKRTQQGTSLLSNHESTPRTRLNFGITGPAITLTNGKTVSENPFTETGEEAHRTNRLQKLNEDLRGGWTFQGKKKLSIRIVSPRQDPTQHLSHTPRLASTPGGKRGQTHSELNHTYFESLGIPVSAGQDFCKAKVWLVLSRDKNERNKVLVHARNQSPLDLPISIRVASPPEERWTQASAQADLVLRLETELEEKILKYKLAIRECLHLECSWQVEPGRGGMECTILAHIHIGTSTINVQNKHHLHWKETDSITIMNNEAKFVAEAHNLLFKNGPSRIDHQCRNPTLAKCGGEAQHLEKVRIGVLWDSRMFRAR